MPTMTNNLFLSFNERIYQNSQEKRNVSTWFFEKNIQFFGKRGSEMKERRQQKIFVCFLRDSKIYVKYFY